MPVVKVVDSIEIAVDPAGLFAIITSHERRFQLSPLWGVAQITGVSEDYPRVGGRYHTRITQGDHAEYDTVVRTYIPGQRFAYELTAERRTSVAWTIQRAASGTRLIYEESFLADDAGDAELIAKVREIVGKWLMNIKRYAELPSSRSGRAIRWGLDRFYLRLRPDQRHVVAALVGLQAISTIGFVMAAIGIGLGSLIF